LIWLIWKGLIWFRQGRENAKLQRALPLPLVIFFFLVTISLLPNFRQAGDYRYFALGVLHCFMVMDLFSAPQRRRLLFLFLALPPGILLIRGVFQDPSVLTFSYMMRFGYPLDHPNTAGYLFAMSIPLVMGVIVTETTGLWKLGVVSLLSQGLGLILTYSRGAWLGSAASILFFGLVAKRAKQVFLLLIVVSAVLFLATPTKQRLFSLADPDNDEALSSRMRIMQDSFEVGLDYPVLGIGYGRGRLKEALQQMYKGTQHENTPTWHAHNVYIDLFAGTGLLGLSAFLWLLGDCLYRVSRASFKAPTSTERMLQISILTALIAFLLTGLGDVPFYHHETRIFFFTLLALVYLRVETAQ
jgi:O-antigen ligase